MSDKFAYFGWCFAIAFIVAYLLGMWWLNRRTRPRIVVYEITCPHCGTITKLVGKLGGCCDLCHRRIAVTPGRGALVGGYQPAADEPAVPAGREDGQHGQ